MSFAHLQAGVYALARQPLEAAEAGGDVFQGMIRGAEDFLKHTGNPRSTLLRFLTVCSRRSDRRFPRFLLHFPLVHPAVSPLPHSTSGSVGSSLLAAQCSAVLVELADDLSLVVAQGEPVQHWFLPASLLLLCTLEFSFCISGYGFFGGISRMAGVASDSLGALACDEVYVHARKQQGRHKARNVEEGLQQGVEALGRALAGGFTGTGQR